MADRYIDDGDDFVYIWDEFLDLIASGRTPTEAADDLDGPPASWYRRYRDPYHEEYDEEFSRRYEKIMEPGGEHWTAYAARVHEAAISRFGIKGLA